MREREHHLDDGHDGEDVPRPAARTGGAKAPSMRSQAGPELRSAGSSATPNVGRIGRDERDWGCGR